MKFDIIINNGKVVDGSGNPWFKADIGIKDGKIKKISRISLSDSKKKIDAKDLVVSPGFIDLHSHSDRSAIIHNRCESSLHMGLTTMGGGQCGSTVYPITDKNKENIISRIMRGLPEDSEIQVDWSSLEGWRKYMEKKGIGANLVPYIGFGTLRRCVMGIEGEGGERYEPTTSELNEMKAMLDQAMREGAFGMSTGLRYSEQRNAFTEEIIELTKVVAKYGGMYISHMRGEGDVLIESCNELVEICEKAGVRGCFSHHKAMYPENWGKPTETMRIIDRSRSRGVEIYCDAYPWIYCSAVHLGSVLVSRRRDVSRKELLKDIKNDEKWAEMKKILKERYEAQVIMNEERKKALAKRGISVPVIWNPEKHHYISYSKTRPDFVGKNFRMLAKTMDTEDPLDAARALFIADEGHTYTAGCWMNEDDLITILKHPTCSPSTDASAYDLTKQPFITRIEMLEYPHPRGWGSYPKVLQRYVRELKILQLEDAIRKMTSLPAQFLDLKDRGLIREEYHADITIFDPEKVENRATYAQPTSYPIGIPYVLVNGQIVIEKGEHTGALPGKVLFHQI